jgi:3-polyprenyl-4-hydroxybenzoate decarboxylase
MGSLWKSFRDWLADEEKLGNVLRIKTPIKCGDYSCIKDIGPGIPGKAPESEIRALVRYLHTVPGKPIAILENPVNNRPDIPVVLNPFPTRERVLRGLGLKTKDEWAEKIEGLEANKIKSVEVPKSKAPCKEVIIREADIDTRKDIPRNWVEFNQVLWTTCNGTIVVRDPETGNHHISKTRLGNYEWQDADPNKPFPEERVKQYGFSTLAYGGGTATRAGVFYRKNYREKGKPCPAAFMFGIPIDAHVVASMHGVGNWPEVDDRYDIVSGLRGEPVELVESETIPGLKVLASAEWVIEGEYLPEDEIMPPYAEDIASGYLFGGERCPIFRIKCITHRKNPVWDATTFSSSGSVSGGAGSSHESPHTGLQFLTCETPAIMYLRKLGYKIKDIAQIGASREVVVVQTEVDGADKPFPHYGKRILMALSGNPGEKIGPIQKYIIIVGPDINPYDMNDVMWAVGTRTRPLDDTIVIGSGLCTWCDPEGMPDPLGWKAYGQQVRIDALIKVPERHTSFPPRGEPGYWEPGAIEAMRKKIESSK